MMPDIDVTDLAMDIQAAIDKRSKTRHVEPPAPEFTTVREVAKRLFGYTAPNVEAKIRVMLKEGKIKGTKAGSEKSSWWVFIDSVDEYIAKSKAVAYDDDNDAA